MVTNDHDWGAEVRNFRLRKKMKQEAVAAHLGVSQAYISRLEAGISAPTPDIVKRIEQLLETRENRPHFEHWLATLRYSNNLSTVLRNEGEHVALVEIGRGYQAFGAPFSSLKPGDRVDVELGKKTGRRMRDLIDLGLFDGDVVCVKGLWAARGENGKFYCRSVNVPVRDDLGEWYVHSTNEILPRETFHEELARGIYPLVIRDSDTPGNRHDGPK